MENLLWIEKYRPLKFDNILGQDKIIKILEKMIENGSFPHLIFSGGSGTGKTSTVMAIVEKLYGKSKTFMVMKLDASDDRGINSVREEIKGFAEKITLFNKGIKLIILDEADAMTFDAQFALRRIVEKYSDTTRFCFICNYENKIIPPIKSRCLNFTFFPVDKKNIIKKLSNICKEENIKYEKDALNVIAELSNGDFRKSINLLQSISMRVDIIKKKYCYETVGLLNNKKLKQVLKMLLNKEASLEYKYSFIKKELIDTGISLSLFLGQLSSIILENTKDIPVDELTGYLIKLSKLEYNVSSSTFGNLYIKSLISIFI
uniref:AAA+ ATPase domain-containing protein n=1 Tax=viral metagenome TaxID=1070528 RepID=A0A6C0J397_9ZZZZ